MNLPFGFGPGDRDPDESGNGGEQRNPLGGFSWPGSDLAGQIPLFAELQKLLTWQGGPVNWDLARQLAVATAAGQSHPVTAADRTALADAMRLADLWLDDVTDLPSGVRVVQAWSRTDWITHSLDGWAALCDPVAARVVTAMASAIPAEMLAQAGPLGQVMSSFGGLMFGAQVGQGIAGLAAEVVSISEVGIPLAPIGTAGLLPQNFTGLATSLDRSEEEVRIYLALREAAYQRLYSHVPWLRQHVLDGIEAYARGITIDTSKLEQVMGQIDPSDPSSIQAALGTGLFEPEQTPSQQAALTRLETLLALIEGWVDTLVDAAATPRLAGAPALREALRRRRATGGPAEQTFATLVGLQLRPRRLREAATLWWAVTDQAGSSGRDAIWDHPDLLPTAADLDDPLEFARRRKSGQPGQIDTGSDQMTADAAAVIEAFEALTAEAAADKETGGDEPNPPDHG